MNVGEKKRECHEDTSEATDIIIPTAMIEEENTFTRQQRKQERNSRRIRPIQGAPLYIIRISTRASENKKEEKTTSRDELESARRS